MTAPESVYWWLQGTVKGVKVLDIVADKEPYCVNKPVGIEWGSRSFRIPVADWPPVCSLG